MSQTNQQPRVSLVQTPEYTESYANSVQVRVSVWDFFLAFGTAHHDTAEELTIRNTHGIYLSPQQAKALWNVLGQNLAQYEQTFGTLALEPQVMVPQGPVN
jgi:flagellar protein FlaG